MENLSLSRQKNFGRKKASSFLMKNSILGNTVQRWIEICVPVNLLTVGATYPAGSATYGAWYSFGAPGSTARNNYYPILQNITSTADYTVQGTSREYTDLMNVYGQCRVITVHIAFVRTFVDTTSIYNLSSLSLAVLPQYPTTYVVNTGTYTEGLDVYTIDGSGYWQPVNSDRSLVYQKFDMPYRSLQDTGSRGLNDWTDSTTVSSSQISAAVGYNLPSVTSSNAAANTFVRQIGCAFIKILFDFAVPRVKSS